MCIYIVYTLCNTYIQVYVYMLTKMIAMRLNYIYVHFYIMYDKIMQHQT